MSKLISKFMILIGALTLVGEASAEETKESVFLQFSRGDLSTIERAVQDALDAAPVQGESSTPMSTPYAFGTITARGIRYSFTTQIIETGLQNGGIRLTLSLRGFEGLIRRLELNESGSSACTNIPIVSPGSDIPVSIEVHPWVSEAGVVQLDVSHANFDLNERNFDVQYPEECHVVYGFDWLVRWTLPWLIESYQDTIADALSKALANGLQERTAELSPFMSLNITLPFEGSEIPSFYAHLSARPNRIDITQNRFQFSFSTSLTIDPDEVSLFSGEALWPEDQSFFGISWQTMDAMLREADAKGIVRATFRDSHPLVGHVLHHDLWKQLFPKIHDVVDPTSTLILKLSGAQTYRWSSDGKSTDYAQLEAKSLRFGLWNEQILLAEFLVDAHVIFGLDSSTERRLSGIFSEIEFVDPMIIANSGILAGEYNPQALAKVCKQIKDILQKSPADVRDLFELKLPSMRVGNHQVIVSSVKTHPAGIILPLSYVRPHLDFVP